MLTLASWVLFVLVLWIGIPVATLFLEVIAATCLSQRLSFEPPSGYRRPRVAILVPAHNESIGLRPTIENVKAQLCAGDRLLVVADNCTDDTSAVAAASGAEVIERDDQLKIGKGFALDWGIKYLLPDPPEIVIVVDADCCFSEGSIDRLVFLCAQEHRPTQALYLMTRPVDCPARFQIEELAWRVKNWIRPLGLRRLGLPCQLAGTGMAFPWEIIMLANLGTGAVVEDLKLGLELAMKGKPSLFCPTARVFSTFPVSQTGADSQRQRWEQGHLNMILEVAPRMIYQAVVTRDVALLALALDLSVPPLSLLCLAEIALLLISGFAVFAGLSALTLYMIGIVFVAFAFAIVLSWWKLGRDLLSVREVLMLPGHVLKKIGLYHWIILRGRGPTIWIRTDRKGPDRKWNGPA
jgi:cellulose synthase/poly-beta-1,6-N-acetylglucosamine synthase-like glycosyltransferase